MNRDPIRTLVFRLTAVTLALLVALSLLAAWSALNSFERALFPELRLKATGVAESLSRQIERALAHDIPLAEVPGLDATLALEAAGHAEIVHVAVEDPAGQPLAAHGERPARLGAPTAGAAAADTDYDIVVPLTQDGVVRARLRLALDPGWLARASGDLMLEVATELLVSVLITFEILLLIVHLSLTRLNALRHAVRLAEAGDFRGAIPAARGDLASVAGACRARLASLNRRWQTLAARGARIEGLRFLGAGETPLPPPVNLAFLRLPVFLFCLSEELSRPFMPAYAKQLAPTAPWLPVDLAVSLPIALFMLIWALSQPIGARLSGRIGRARAFAAAAGLAALGLTMTAHTEHLLAFLGWRCVTAFGYGVALIAAQGLVVDHTSARNRASGLALFIGALLAAGVCGPAIGGIVADRAGAAATLLLGAGMAPLAAALLILLFRRASRPAPPAPAASAAGASPFAALSRDLRFAVLMLCSGIPAKIAATGVLFCLVPLMLTEHGATKAEIGRVQMLYFIGFILASPAVAGLADRWRSERAFIVLGGLATLGGLAGVMLSDAGWSAALAIGLFGLAQAMIAAPQLTLITRIAERARVPEVAAIGWYRLLERLGGALGPLLAVALAAAWSYRGAVVGLGLLCGVGALAFWLLYRQLPPLVVAESRP